MTKNKLSSGTGSDDMDSLCFGTDILYKGLTGGVSRKI